MPLTTAWLFVCWYHIPECQVLIIGVATELLKKGKVKLTGCFSEKIGKTYDAIVLLDDTGGKYVNFKMEFAKR